MLWLIQGKTTSYELKPGMVLSNEPGYYKPDEYGIRIENMIFVTQINNSGNFCTFEDLTMVCMQWLRSPTAESW